MIFTPTYVPLVEGAKVLGVASWTLRRWALIGKIPCLQRNGELWFDKDGLERIRAAYVRFCEKRQAETSNCD